MVARDVPVAQIARDLGVDKSTVRHNVVRGMDTPNGRRERVADVLLRFDDPRTDGDEDAAVEAAVLHGVRRREFGFTGSSQAVRLYRGRTYPAPGAYRAAHGDAIRVKAQHDWFDTVVRVADVALRIHALLGPAVLQVDP